jgi:hypothetical protein
MNLVHALPSICSCKRSSNCFSWKALTSSWAHKLLKTGEVWHPCLHFISIFALSHSLYSHFAPWIPERSELITSLWQGTETSHKEQWRLGGQTTPPDEDNDLQCEAVPWSRSNPYHPLKWWQWWHLLQNSQTEIMVNQNTPVAGTV